MALSRRTFGSIALRVMGFLSLTAFFEETSGACIYGKWLLVCPRFPKQHADFVDDGTCPAPMQQLSQSNVQWKRGDGSLPERPRQCTNQRAWN